MRIPTLLQKINDLAAQPERRTAIDVDLMLDYTRVLYADLLEWRSRLPATTAGQQHAPVKEPTRAEAAEQQQPATTQTELPAAKAEQAAAKTEQAATTIEPVATKPEQTASATEHPIGETPEVQGPSTIAKPPIEQNNGRDIRSQIGINDKYQIMSELFSNDRDAYEQALDFINQSKNEQTAMHWLREQLWITEEHSDAAQSFFEIVGRFFRK